MQLHEVQLELIGYNICPYVQRVAILIKEQRLNHKVTLIDLSDKPSWLLEKSPLSKVPLLKVGDQVLFESGSIVEFLNDYGPFCFLPEDLVHRAIVRSSILYIDKIHQDLRKLFVAKTDLEQETGLNEVRIKSRYLEQLANGPYCYGETLTLADFALAPLLNLMNYLERTGGYELLADTPRLRSIHLEMSRLNSAQNSISHDYGQAMDRFILKQGSLLSKKIAKKNAITMSEKPSSSKKGLFNVQY